jgi:tRNA nucleotidyltransferase/poly(A) polymerase
MEFYMVGGAVRDELLGVKSKDIDFTVVIDKADQHPGDPNFSFHPHDPFKVMVRELKHMGFTIFLETPEFLTVRAQFPQTQSAIVGGTPSPLTKGLTADFVLARKESDYTDGRRPDKVEPGTLMDDLKRRDFTMNAIAKDSEGNLIDPFNGQYDIEHKVIRAVGDPRERFEEDALRIVRALRFSVTKGFDIDHETEDAMWRLRHTVAGVSAERVREELTKMFNADPMKTIQVLREMDILPIIFGMGINFQPTMKQKVR